MAVRDKNLVTKYASSHLDKLEKAGYLHSSYDRFKEITHYNKIIHDKKIAALGDKIIKAQEKREQDCYKILGVKNAQELNEKYLSDEGIQTFIESSFNNIYNVLADTMKDVLGSSNLSQNVSKSNQKKLADNIENSFNQALQGLSQDYQKNLEKLNNRGTISKEVVSSFRNIDNRTQENKIKKAGQMARTALGQWKGSLGEAAVGLFASQLNNIKGVEVTGGNIDELGKFIKSDVTTYTDSLDIGFSVKNYKIQADKETGNKFLPHDITLHSGGSFDTLLKRLQSLHGGEVQQEVDEIVRGLSSDNYYYNLINEAIETADFSSSDPAQDFIDTIKGLAAAWFGTQLVVNSKEGLAGQNVDFFVISNYGVIPMSSLLKGLKTQAASLKVNIKSTASIDEEEFYESKISEYYNPNEGYYNQSVLNIGFYGGQEIYSGIQISEIKLSLILSKINI